MPQICYIISATFIYSEYRFGITAISIVYCEFREHLKLRAGTFYCMYQHQIGRFSGMGQNHLHLFGLKPGIPESGEYICESVRSVNKIKTASAPQHR